VPYIERTSVTNALRIEIYRLERRADESRRPRSISIKCLAFTVYDVQERIGNRLRIRLRSRIPLQVEHTLGLTIGGLVRTPPHRVAIGVLGQDVLVPVGVHETRSVVLPTPRIGIKFERTPLRELWHNP